MYSSQISRLKYTATGNMLQLHLPKHARCLVRRVHRNAYRLAESQALWALATTGDERRVWERLYTGDHVVLWDAFEQHFDLLAAEIIGKSLDLSVPKSEQPLRLAIKIHGTTRVRKLPLHGYNIRDDLFCPPGEFLELWSQCATTSSARTPYYDETFFSFRGIGIRVATSLDDLQYIQDFAKAHSFGYRTAFITLVASDASGPVGAILAQPCLSTSRPHSAAARVFGAEYEDFRQDSLSIKRIFNNEKSAHKLEIHEALLRGFVEAAPFLVEGSLRIIEAVSYDPHPLTHKLGFYAELPNSPTDSIYYWRPFNLPHRYVEKRAPNSEDTRRGLHELVSARANLKFYGVFGRLQSFGRAIREKAWALEDSGQNRGVWKSLRAGDVVFFVRDRQVLEGYGVVERIRNDSSLPRYPLRIDFALMEVPYIAADLTQNPYSDWILLPSHGGIFLLQNMGGSQLRMAVDLRHSEGKMWVKPNPYLLHGTEFLEIPKQVFVVQAWSLKDDVLPTLREVLSNAGYQVTHAEDREGQIIFGDVWRLLNEAEIVLVDFTQKRPNVYLEYGMALVLGKPIVAISQSLDDMPSDTPQLKTILYQNTMSGTVSLSEKLLRAVADRIAGKRQLDGR